MGRYDLPKKCYGCSPYFRRNCETLQSRGISPELPRKQEGITVRMISHGMEDGGGDRTVTFRLGRRPNLQRRL